MFAYDLPFFRFDKSKAMATANPTTTMIAIKSSISTAK